MYNFMYRFGIAIAVGLAAVAAVLAAGCVDESRPATATDVAIAPLTQEPSPTPGSQYVPGVVREGPPDAFAYTVQAGDTLFSLAQRFGTTVETLVTLNAIDDVTDIAVGAVIFIPNTPTPTATSVPSGPSLRVDHGPRDSNVVALTFDMGGRVAPALAIMQFLIDNDVRATIFPTGSLLESVNTDVGRQVLALVDQHGGQFALGNHSYSHPDFRDLSAAGIADELSTTEAAIAAHTALNPRPFFRPPFGAVDDHVLSAVGAAGYAYTIMWDIDTIDWLPEADGGPTTQQMVDKVVNGAKGGTIVLMHLGGYNTLEALPAIVAGLKARGLEPVTLGELLSVR
ncbi:MAG: polysaccharide deacetylase family protein [Dehalococcoidia bacterium]|nr:polysaccharide deacetylase family protein [Dehalococcoidia bacterium]